jgi:plasmid stabilization system protein ParE
MMQRMPDEGGSGDGAEDLELAKIAVHILSGYTPRDRERARRAYVDAFEDTFRARGLEPPEWIGRLRDEPWEGSERD